MDVAVCRWRSDVRKTVGSSVVMDAMELDDVLTYDCDYIITNPPYERKVLLPMIYHFINIKPTWLLLPADMMHNKYFSDLVSKCRKIYPVGRLYWQDNKVKGKQNFCWYYWPKYGDVDYPTEFFGRE